jgi:hypothetical protein
MDNSQLERLKSKLELRNIIIDKAIIGILIAVFGWWLSVQLEAIKSEIRMNESAQDKKLTAIAEIQIETASLYSEFTNYHAQQREADYNKWKTKHNDRVKRLIRVINKNALYVSEKLDNELQVIVNLHAGLCKFEERPGLKYDQMFNELNNIINSILRYETGLEINRNTEMDKYIITDFAISAEERMKHMFEIYSNK